jgi:AcrR family transcriptional regulator
MENPENRDYLLQCIAKAYTEKLRDRPLASVTVSQICEAANISRMTFYRHFKSKDEIVEANIRMIYQRFHEEVTLHARHGAYIKYENLLLACRYFERYADYISYLVENDMVDRLYKIMIDDELEMSLNSRNDPKNRYLTIAYASAVCSVLVSWVRDGMTQPAEEMAALLCDVFQTKLRRY